MQVVDNLTTKISINASEQFDCLVKVAMNVGGKFGYM
jgi:hypothetical protein